VGILAQVCGRRTKDVGEIDGNVATVALGPLPLPQIGGYLDDFFDFSPHGCVEFNLLHHSLYLALKSHCEWGPL